MRMLTYTGMLYEKLIDDGVLCSQPWTAAEDVAELIAFGYRR